MLKKLAQLCARKDLEGILVKLWRVAQLLANPKQIGYLSDVKSKGP